MTRQPLQAAALAICLCLPIAAQAQDLSITSTTAPSSGSTAQAGSLFKVQYTVANSGTAATSTFYVAYYFCQATTTPQASCQYLSRDTISGGLGAGSSKTVTSYSNLRVPTAAEYGTGYVRFVADYLKHINETNETNNNAHSSVSITKRPDLYSQAISFPYSGSISTVGSLFTGRYYIVNAGSGSKLSTNFTMKFDYCPKKEATGCILLGTQNVTTDILSGSTSGYIITPNLSMPQGAQNGTRYIRITTDSTSAVTEHLETNNVYWHTITVDQVESNLKITSFTVPNSGVSDKAGDKITVKNTIKNDAIHGFTIDFRVQYYYCHTQGTTSCTSLTYMSITQDFTPGQSVTYTSPTLTLPTTLRFGTGYIRAMVDSTKKILEGSAGELDNNAYGAINATVRPDLLPAYYSFPYTGSTATIGSQFVGRYRVRNASYTTQCFQAFKMTFHFCPTNTTATASCTKLGESTYPSSTPILAGGYSAYLLTPTLTIPSNARNGTRYIRITVDSDNVVVEKTETNNVYNAGITVSLIKSDLKFGTVTLPNSGSTKQAGSYFTTNYTLTNASANGFDTDFQVRFYYCSASGTALASCTYITSNTVKDNFSPNQSRLYTSTSMAMPLSSIFGTGYIRIIADYADKIPEGNEVNNIHEAKINVTTKPDLYPNYVTAPLTGSTAGPGSQFTVRYRVYNKSGTSRIETDFDVAFYYCETQSASACTLLTTTKITTNLNSGAYIGYLYSPTLTLPKGVKIGTRYLRVFVDPANAISENLETNNNVYDAITITKQQVDLSVVTTKAPATGDTKAAGSTFTAKISVRATGGALTSGFTISYAYCTAKSASACTPLGSSSVTHQFTAGETKEFSSPTLTLPKTAKFGSGFIRFQVDAGNSVAESNETNNEVYGPMTVSTGPDLAILAGTVPVTGSTAKPGATFSAQYTVQNSAKTAAISTAFTVGFYYCTVSSASGCTLLGNVKVTKQLNSGDSTTITTPTLTIPAGATAGTGYIRAWLDINNDITESNENNNDRYDAVVGTSTPDLIISLLQATVSGQTVDYLVVVCNQGDATKDSIGLELYYNPTGTPGCTTTADQSWTLTGGLAKSGCTSRTYKRANVKPGGYLAWARADADCKIKEKDEGNNNKSIAYTIATLPDMGVDMGVDMGADAGVDSGLDGLVDGLGDGLGDGLKDGLGDGLKDGLGDGLKDGLSDGEAGVVEGGTADLATPDLNVTPDLQASLDATSSGEAGADGGGTVVCPPGEASGCDCRMDSARDATAAPLWLMLLVAVFLLRRLRSRKTTNP